MSLTVEPAIQQAVKAHNRGDLQKAEQLYRAILAATPQHPDANHNLGILAASAGKVAEGLPYLKTAVNADPERAQFWISHIAALIAVGDIDSARIRMEEASARDIKHPDLNRLKADLAARKQSSSNPAKDDIAALTAAYDSGDWEIALGLAETMQRRYPQFPPGWSIAGCIYAQTGQPDQALPLFRELACLCPDNAISHSNLGSVLRDLGFLSEAEQECRRAIECDTGFADAHYNLGNTLRDLGRYPEAEAHLIEALRLKPEFVAVQSNLGHLYREIRQPKDAIRCFREVVRRQPEVANGWCNLGNALQDVGHMGEAIDCYDKALSIEPDSANTHNNLGSALREIGELEEAETHYRAALRINPKLVLAHSNLLFLLSSREGGTPSDYLQEAREYGHLVSSQATLKFSAWHCARDARTLRVGLVSPDLRNHPVGYFLESLLPHVDGTRIEFLGFPVQQFEDNLTDRLKTHLREWIPINNLDDAAASRQIHEQGVHILIDLAGHTANNRLGLFAYKAAPIQVSWLGYWASTGLPEMDYVLGDPYVTPFDEEGHFTETPWRLPESYLCFSRPLEDDEVTPLPYASNGFITFGCFNNPAKMRDPVVDVWARILEAVPSSRLFLKAKSLQDSSLADAVVRRFGQRGIPGDRLLLEGFSDRASYLRAYHKVDIGLDPFPYHGGTTTAEALWMGVPVLTLRGQRFLSHIGESIAHNSGQSDWIAIDEADYVQKAIALARQPDELARVRADLRHQVSKSPLFDAPRFAQALESALWGMWDRCTG